MNEYWKRILIAMLAVAAVRLAAAQSFQQAIDCAAPPRESGLAEVVPCFLDRNVTLLLTTLVSKLAPPAFRQSAKMALFC